MLKMNSFRSVLEDIEWLWNEWWIGEPDSLSEGHIRRGSSTLQLLLCDGLLQKAWKHYNFARQLQISAPDIVDFAIKKGYKLDLAAFVYAGGGRQDGKDMALLGAFRADHPTTGVSADAEEGFAVSTTMIVSLATDKPEPSPHDPVIKRPWNVSEYLESAGAVRRGIIIKRREIIEYFRNYVGGTHHDLLKGARHAKRARYELIAELENRAWTFIRDALHFELLSIGQAVARSADVQVLAEKIRKDPSTFPNRPVPPKDVKS